MCILKSENFWKINENFGKINENFEKMWNFRKINKKKL